MKKVAWWIIKIVCGVAAVLGTLLVAMGSMELYFLLLGRVVPSFEQPGVPFVTTYWVTGLVLMIGGYKLPGWLKIDRLLLIPR